jgi:hypothetical protein
MSKTYTLVTQNGSVEYGSKKTAVKYGDESGETYEVLSPSGAVVHHVDVYEQVPEAPEPVEEPVSEPTEDLIGETPVDPTPEPVYTETIDFPGNYSIVTAPLALAIAEAAGVPAKSENVAGRLNRIVSFGGDDAKTVAKVVEDTVADALEALKVWQKANIEKRRDLTDMQRYVQHREFIADFGAKVAKNVKKSGL